jgi:hypothetical protein
MNLYCNNINLPIYPLRVDIDTLPKVYWTALKISDVNSNLLSFFIKHGTLPTSIASFYSEGFIEHPIHIDNTHESDMVKFIWTFGENHLMNWFATKNNFIEKKAYAGDGKLIDSRYHIPYLPHEVSLVHSQPVGFPSLIQAGIPHNVVNFSGERRCISIALVNIKTREYITMAHAIKLFNDYIL